VSDARRATATPREATFFDVDGTLVQTTIAHYYAYFRRARMARPIAGIWHAWFLMKCGYFMILDRINRSMMNRVFYRGYRGLPVESTKAQSIQCYKDVILPRQFEQAPRAIEQHRQAGRRIVLVTGSIDFIIRPLAEALNVDAVLAARLVERDGHFTGALDGPPIGEQEKAVCIRRYAAQHNIDLSRSYGYGDSIADLPMLETVANAEVVNPDSALEAIARDRGWPIHRWTVAGQRG